MSYIQELTKYLDSVQEIFLKMNVLSQLCLIFLLISWNYALTTDELFGSGIYKDIDQVIMLCVLS